jgi:HD superfamily phosphodiesterase
LENGALVARVPDVPSSWFLSPQRAEGIHGRSHIQRVYLLAQRLTAALDSPPHECELLLQAVLWHDIGRTHDGVEPEHGARSVERVGELGLAGGLDEADRELIFFAMRLHSLPDEDAPAAAQSLRDPAAALHLLWLLKDADGLDRVRIYDLDPSRLRFAESRRLVDDAWELLRLMR